MALSLNGYMATVISIIVFRAIQLVLLPFALVGYIIFAATLTARSRRLGISATMLASLYSRYMQHRLGVRQDEPAAKLMMAMPNVSHVGLYLTTAPTLAAHRVTGYVPAIYRYPYAGEPPMGHQPSARTTFYDQALTRHLDEVKQLVILGAGFDTRAFRIWTGDRISIFEVDAPRNQAYKLEMLNRAGLVTPPVKYVPADFLKDDWMEKLVAAGFDRGKPSLFTWESVTMYLDRDAVESSLKKIAATTPGTLVAFDYFSDEIISSDSPFWRYARAMISATGESWRFGIDNTPPVRVRVADFLASCGLTLIEQRNFGEETKDKRAPAGFAIAVVPSTAELQ